MKTEVSKILKTKRKEAGLSVKEVVSTLKLQGISVAEKTIYGWESGNRQPDADTFLALCKVYNINAFPPTDTKTAPSLSDEAIQIAKDYSLLDPPGKRAVKVILRDQQDRMSEATVIPFPNKRNLPKSIQTVSAGRGAYLGPEEMETIDVIENDLTLRASFCVPVSSDSMEPTYHDGDILLVEGCEDIPVGQIGVFTVDGDGYGKKRGEGELSSLNPDYDPVPMVENDTWCNGLVIGVLDPEWVVE